MQSEQSDTSVERLVLTSIYIISIADNQADFWTLETSK